MLISSRFRWVVCQLDVLHTCNQPSKVRKALKSLPRTLDATYDRMLLRIDKESQGQALSALKWLAFSARPLDIKELAEAVVVNPREDPRFDPEDRLFDSSELLRFLPGLVALSSNEGPTGNTNEIKLAHFSVKEYLVSRRVKAGPASRYFIQEIPASISIAETCIAYLLQFGTPDSLTPQTFEEFPLVRYAAQYWTQHARVAGGDASVVQLLIMEFFLSKRDAYVTWLRIFDPDEPWKEPTLPGNLSENMKSPYTPLYLVSKVGLVESVKLLLEKGAEANAEDNSGTTALHMAAFNGHEEIVKLLIEKGADVNAKNSSGWTPLHRAAFNGDEDIVKLLFEKGADVNAKDGNGWTPLYRAVFNGHEGMVKLLLAEGAEVNARDSRGETALHVVAFNGYEQIVKLLLENGAEVDVKDNNRWTPPLHVAAFNGHEEVVKLLLEKGAEINVKGNNEWTPLHAATFNGYEKIVKLLLEKGAQIDVRNSTGCAPLHTAASAGHEDIVKLLLEKGAEVNAKDSNGWMPLTPLHRAASDGQQGVVRLLLEKGAE
ncbi:hypothetical protein GP486_006045, partial [Trichoglossum hirsutum]